MRHRLLGWGGLLVLALLVSACTAATTPQPTTAALPTDVPANTQAPPTETDIPTEIAAVIPSPTAETLPAEATDAPANADAAMVMHADAPASPDEFRSDSGEFVGATGSPQLVEFFAYW